MKQKSLSIIIPYYNSRNSLRVLLESIVYFDGLEVIVVNDHSDCILDVTSEFEYVETYDQEQGKRWAGAARNLGLSKATGKYIMFADADDRLVSGRLTPSLIDQLDGMDCDVVYFSPASISLSGGRSSRHVQYAKLVENYIKAGDDAIRYKFYVPWSKIIRSNLIACNEIEFDEIEASNDINFSLKIGFYAKNIAAIDEPIYCVVESDSSLTKCRSESVLDSRFLALCRCNDFLIRNGLAGFQSKMAGNLYNNFRFSLFKVLSMYFFCLYKKYRIF
jgi:glycosyltransferase involved in cell wall biosynthesis